LTLSMSYAIIALSGNVQNNIGIPAARLSIPALRVP
jgi:hypothetical protein